ncbi:DUF1150 family protein [Roseospira navarrensis]|nr:DUF1150 family protein [Roseospira navarrensis]
MTRNSLPPAEADTPETDDMLAQIESGHMVGDMSPRDFAQLGLNHIAYIRAVETEDNETGWSIHAANGRQIGMAPSCDLAFAATRQHDMEPHRVH